MDVDIIGGLKMKEIKFNEEFIFIDTRTKKKHKARLIWTRYSGLTLSLYDEKFDVWSREV